ncbi:MAG: hypothetical protein CMA10_01315 [Euryarchaeota archaeon]|nr:hypothetical protein [Euryarchaeota archaeon]
MEATRIKWGLAMDGDEDWEEEEEILENATHCPTCDNLEGHDILKEKSVGSGADFLVRCQVCSHVHTIEFRPPVAKNIPFILTDGPHSQRIVLVIDADEEFVINDVFEEDEKLWKVHQIEAKDGTQPDHALATEVERITAIRTDRVRVKMTLTRGEDSHADVIIVPQETTFTASHLMEHEGETWRIRAIHTGSGRTLRGTVQAPDIKRMYLHEPPRPEHFAPRTPRERRQAWKEGKLGHNPNPIRPKEEIKKGVTPSFKRKKKPRR